MEVETDRQPAYAKLVRVGTALSFEASESIRLMTGNASGLELRLNGEPVIATGAQGRVRTIEFTGEGTRVLKAAVRIFKS